MASIHQGMTGGGAGPAHPLDWAELQTLLLVSRAGSLSAAARASGLSQPTLSRRLAALEGRLGATLFHRGARGATPTPLGKEILGQARLMDEAAARIALAAHAGAPGLSGVVRVAASRIVAQHHLPAILSQLMEDAPGLEIELSASDEIDDLARREADIAVRMVRPEQPELVARHVCDFPIGLWAHESYLARHGTPRGMEDLQGHRFCGYDRSDLMRRGMRALGFEAPRALFRFRSDDQPAVWAAACAGCGISPMQVAVGARAPGMARVMPEARIPPMPCWLAMPETIRHAPAVRRVWDALAAGLAAAAKAGGA